MPADALHRMDRTRAPRPRAAGPEPTPMDLQLYLDHWKLSEHPFRAEEARSDSVYNRVLEGAVAHPDFAKIYGDPARPSSTIVFGEKGSGKTAMRLMMQRKIEARNRERETGRTWLVCYDDLNPTLDRLSRNLREANPDRVLKALRLADHQDAILSLAATELIDSVLSSKDRKQARKTKRTLRQMSEQQRVDLATLALLYDQPRAGQIFDRWERLLSLLKLRSWWGRGPHSACNVVLALVGLAGGAAWRFFDAQAWEWKAAAIAGGAGFALSALWWLGRSWRNLRLARQIGREIRVVERPPGVLARQLWEIDAARVAAQPIPKKSDQDTRYELTARLVRLLDRLGHSSLVALVDRVDEPVLIHGDASRIKRLVWPMLDNKFLQQEGVAIKMLLPVETSQLLAAEDAQFQKQARMDKQSVVNPLKWTGATLYDLCSWRLRQCRRQGAQDSLELEDLFDDDVTRDDLIDALDQMHQPRDAFKLLYASISEHCKNTAGSEGAFAIPRTTLDQARREQSQRLTNLYRGFA